MKKELNHLFVKYRRRVIRRAIIKSVFIGLIIAFFAMFVTAAVIFFVDATRYFWISFAVLGVVACVSILVLYFAKYRPSEKDIAAALDALGLEERAITMLELEGSKSFMAEAQREDTVSAVSSVPAAAIKATTSTAVIVLLVIAIVLGLGAGTYTILDNTGVAPSSGSIFASDDTPIYTVSYEEYDEEETYLVNGESYAVGDGSVEGASVQMVREGEDCTTVYAVAGPDCIFVEWSDGVATAERTDKDIREDMDIYAVFVEYAIDEEGDLSDGDNEAEEGDDSDSSDKEDEGDSEEGDDSDSGNDDGGDTGEGSGGDTGGASGASGNEYSIFDGGVNIFDELEAAIEDFREMLNGDYGLTDEQRAAINAYIDALMSAAG